MLKYFKRQKSRLGSSNTNEYDDQNHNSHNSVLDEIDGGGGGAIEESSAAAAAAAKRHSLRSTSSFCDEVFLEELANMGMTTTVGIAGGGGGVGGGGGGGSGSEEDTVSYGALSLGALSCSNHHVGAAAASTSVMAVNSIVEFDEDLFRYHSRLSMSVTSIVNEPNCLSYFVQYLENHNALPLIKFYLDTENFKNAALSQLRKEQKHKLMELQIPEEETELQRDEEAQQDEEVELSTNNHTDDKILENKQQQRPPATHQSDINDTDAVGGGDGAVGHINGCGDSGVAEGAGAAGGSIDEVDNSNVPELKTLCDLTMRKPLTDDEKSQFYAETNKQLTKSNNHNKLKASSELSLCSLISNFTEISESVVISTASVQDALTIYQKYLSGNSKQHIDLPVDILSKISLILCKREQEHEEELDSNCSIITADCFIEAQNYVLNKLEMDFLNDFLQSTYYTKYCIELIQGHNLNINDILHSEVTLFYLMEYLEQHQERDCLDFWSSAINYRKSYLAQEQQIRNEKEAQSDAMIIYEKFFSLQNEIKLWSSNKLRAHVESCICSEGLVFYCFDLPLKVAAKYLECKYLKSFLKSPLFANYVNELKTRIQDEIMEHKESLNQQQQHLHQHQKHLHLLHKSLRRCASDKSSNRHRKTMSDCTLDKKLTISQHNTLLASMDNSNHSASHLKQFHLNIDSSQLTNPDLLWHRSNSNNLKFGRVNSLGRYERDFVAPSDALQHNNLSKSSSSSSHNWSLSLSGNKLKNAMRKLVNLPEDNVQEEIAWQVAEMIVKDVTSVTMRGGEAAGVATAASGAMQQQNGERKQNV